MSLDSLCPCSPVANGMVVCAEGGGDNVCLGDDAFGPENMFEIPGVGAKLDVADIAFCSGASSVLTGVGDRFAGHIKPVRPGAPSILSDRVELAGASNEVDGFGNKAAGGAVLVGPVHPQLHLMRKSSFFSGR